MTLIFLTKILHILVYLPAKNQGNISSGLESMTWAAQKAQAERLNNKKRK